MLRPDELLGQRAAIERAYCAASLAGFVRRAWPVLEPGQPLKWGWALDAICAHLEAVADGRLTRLLINIPPGTAKSLLTGVFLPAWLWGPRGRPHARFIGSSYSEAYAARDARRMRSLVTSDWYRALWGDTVRLDRVAETSFSNTATGFRQGVPFSRLTAGRADILVLDDPHSVAEAESEAERERTVRLFRESVTTRLNDPERTAIVVVMQRLHERDISGVILAEGLGYEHLMLPMRMEPERRCATGIGFVDRRAPGALLFPERFSAETVERDEKAMGAYAVAAQFQQRPAPRGGGLLKVEHLQIVDDWPRDAASVRRWDFAATTPRPGTDPDYTAGVKLAWKDGRCWVVDVKRERLTPRGVELLVRATAEQDGPGVPVLLEQEPGSSGVSVLDHYRRQVLAGYAAYASRVTGSKVQRAEPFAAAVEAGNVLLVRGAWNDAFVDECRAFPAGAHDDQVDATADGFAWLGRRARAAHGTGGGGVIAVEALPGSGLHPGYGYPGCGIPYGDGLGYGERPVDDVGVVG